MGARIRCLREPAAGRARGDRKRCGRRAYDPGSGRIVGHARTGVTVGSRPAGRWGAAARRAMGCQRRRLLPVGARHRRSRSSGDSRARCAGDPGTADSRTDDSTQPAGTFICHRRARGCLLPGEPDLHERRRAAGVRRSGRPGLLRRPLFDRALVLGGEPLSGPLAGFVLAARGSVGTNRPRRGRAPAAWRRCRSARFASRCRCQNSNRARGANSACRRTSSCSCSASTI